MAIIREMNPVEQAAWDQWVSTLPSAMKDLATRFPPWKLYRLKPPGQRVVIVSYSENNTMKVSVLGKYNQCLFERNVFGVKPEDLEECDLPAQDELVGVVLKTKEEIQAHIEKTRNHMQGFGKW